ncbi:MAG: RodZ domain-containing protein, partial [Paracoccaceae bacterium]
FTGVMQPGQTYEVPQTAAAPVIRVGNMGAIYFAVNGQTYGPAGNSGEVANVALNVDRLTAEYTVADLTSDRDLRRVVAELNAR